MSVLIEGMKMPKNCEIIIRIDEKGEVYVYGQYPTKIYKAIPVPPHGRLIDADAIPYKKIMYDKETDAFYYGVTKPYIDRMSTVIPADKDGEDDV